METTKSGRVVRSMNNMLQNEMIEDVEEEEEDDYDYNDDENFGEGSRKKKVQGKRGGSGSGGGGGGGAVQPCCQVEGCTSDMSHCKTYHRRHKVCELHSKAAVVINSGCQQRFCQQCSRFHDLLEFDDAKRSCRRRLAGHNERRRKSSYETYGESS